MNHTTKRPPGLTVDGALEAHALLGFLAALGTLTLLSPPEGASSLPGLKLGWRRGIQHKVRWEGPALTRAALLDGLEQALKAQEDAPTLCFAPYYPKGEAESGLDLPVAPEVFRILQAKVLEALSTQNPQARAWADQVLAYGAELYPSEEPKRLIQDTAFRTMSGAGHQHLLGTVLELFKQVKREHLEKSLLAPWQYQDERLSLRFDALDDRRYALRAGNPSNDPTRTEWAANLLAFFGLSCFPTAVQGRRLETTGFQERRFRFPVWETPISLQVIRSLLGHPALWTLDALSLKGLGVVSVYEVERLSLGKFRSFSPSRRVWGQEGPS